MSLWDVATGIIDLLTLPWASRKAEAAAREAVRKQYEETDEYQKLRALDEKAKALKAEPPPITEDQK